MISLEDAILIAIAQGANTTDELANIFKMRKETIEKVLKRLEGKGYVRFTERGWWIFRKKVVELTEEGNDKALEAFEKLRSIAEEVKNRISSEGEEAIRGIINTWPYIIPLLLWLNLLDLALLSSMFFAPTIDFDTGDMDTDVM